MTCGDCALLILPYCDLWLEASFFRASAIQSSITFRMPLSLHSLSAFSSLSISVLIVAIFSGVGIEGIVSPNVRYRTFTCWGKIAIALTIGHPGPVGGCKIT